MLLFLGLLGVVDLFEETLPLPGPDVVELVW